MEFFKHRALSKEVDLNDAKIIKAMSTNVAGCVVCREFEKVLREKIIKETTPELLTPLRMLSTTDPYPFSRLLFESEKTVFNYVTCDNELERQFAKFLDQSNDVNAFAKLPIQFRFCIVYTDTRANIRNYYPDFIVKLSEGEFWVIETNGSEDLDVAMKDREAICWCEYAPELTGKSWNYLKVNQSEIEKLKPENFGELLVGCA
ncbi:MAG: hypothetical protein L6422_06905 [Candidatus Marinimicrobia bacterium]|nr:hypothetical protein [bacterium]MCG2715997.1 hypothetical protein [Candidatus Neomarinimicrobiota bacterium]